MRLLTAVSGVRVPQQAPSSPQGDSRRTSRISARFLHPLLRLLFASQKCKTFAVLLVPAELSRRSLIFAPRGGFAAVSFFFSFSFYPSNPLTLFSPCTTPACRSVGENMLFRRALRFLRGSSPLAGIIVAARRTSQHLAQKRGVFACMPALNPTENSFGGDPDLCPTENTFGGDPEAPLRVAKMQDVRCAPRSCGTIAPLSRFCSARRLRRGFFPFFFVLLEPPDAVIPHRKYFRWGPRFMPHRKCFRWGPRFDAGGFFPAENAFFNST